uniref:Uncharacterized protein n=1 Tax=Nelumbo nucifera TaxID=4432 RepID=A0A822ZZ17_NELNU|nr:TPA_asm: hypothetical protein HUJ06_018013 [Nelumbo nucifera]
MQLQLHSLEEFGLSRLNLRLKLSLGVVFMLSCQSNLTSLLDTFQLKFLAPGCRQLLQ